LVAWAARIWPNWALFRIAKGGPVGGAPNCVPVDPVLPARPGVGIAIGWNEFGKIESVRPNFDRVPLRDAKLARKR
jgi:hypothetical protein